MEVFLKTLAEQGVLGILLVICMIAIYYLFKIIVDLQQKRVMDAKESRDSIIEPMKSVKQTLDLILSIIQTGKGRK